MAAALPEPFKKAGLAPFAQRAAQLEKFDPVVAYWSEYCIVKQALDKGLHTEGDDAMAFTTTLMDKLERIKAAHSENDAILDDVAAQAYIENFALKTFQRADNAMRANQASLQTADTFRAAATFLEILNIWTSPLPQDIESKIRFAKYHALRIAKAIKAGEDPNLSNPPPDPEPSPGGAPVLDPQDPEVQRINGLQPAIESGQSPLQSPSKPSVATAFGSAPNQQPDVSPLEPSPAGRQGSIGGGYFPSVPSAPSVPTFTSENSAPSQPTAPMEGSLLGPNGSSPDPQDFYMAQRAPVHQPSAREIPMFSPTPQAPPVVPMQQPTTEPEVMPGRYRSDDESIAMAQKHAKWAVSALNFEDVDTAVKELRVALRALGAS